MPARWVHRRYVPEEEEWEGEGGWVGGAGGLVRGWDWPEGEVARVEGVI